MKVRIPDWLRSEAERSDIPAMVQIASQPAGRATVELTLSDIAELIAEAEYQSTGTDCNPYKARYKRLHERLSRLAA